MSNEELLKRLEEAERICKINSLFNSMMAIRDASTSIAAADARIAELEAEVEDLNNSREQMRRKKKNFEQRAETAEQALDEARKALTPSAETKAAYMGEFYMPVERYDEETESMWTDQLQVPWTTIKEIMKAIRARAVVGSGKE